MSEPAPQTSNQSQKQNQPGAADWHGVVYSDGCSDTVIQFKACFEHDLDYVTGRVSRREADRKLFWGIYPESPLWAWVYWISVRIGGWRRYRQA